MYRVTTKFNINYDKIDSWEKWSYDETFLVFSWCGGKILILKLSDIQSIEQI